MNKFTVTIQSAHYGTWDYSGQPEEYLIQNEERSFIQVLSLILSHLIFYKLKLNGNFYETVENKSQLVKEIYQTIKKENYFEISYWNPTNWSETTIGIEKNLERFTKMKIRIISPYHNKRFAYEGSIEEWNQLLDTHIEESNISTLLCAVGLYFHGTATISERIGKSKLVQVSQLLQNCA